MKLKIKSAVEAPKEPVVEFELQQDSEGGDVDIIVNGQIVAFFSTASGLVELRLIQGLNSYPGVAKLLDLHKNGTIKTGSVL